jgi:orotate phosphoribosyltransferase-like protein
MNKNDQQFMARKIRTQYMEKTPSELDALRELDAKVKRPANVFAYAFGSISAIIMGAGMSLVMTDIGAVVGIENAMVPGIAVGVVGLGMALLTYPIYKGILGSRKKKYGAEILSLSEKILNQ